MRATYFFLFLISAVYTATAQKIKYKDLFYLLSAKNYDVASPLLKTYLSEPKHADEGSPNLQMGFIYQSIAEKTDILIGSEDYVKYADSAIIFYNYAFQYIDEKEVKKNEEYYHEYQRRDLRTGKFGVKLTDVQYDIENRIKLLTERKNQIIELKKYYQLTNAGYRDAVGIFKKIRDDFPTQKILYLRADGRLIKRMDELDKAAKEALQNYRLFENTIKQISKPGYNPSLQLTEIIDYEQDGETPLILTKDNVLFWDYTKWIASVKDGIQQIIVPMRASLVSYDQHLDRLLERIAIDSMSLLRSVKPMEEVLAKLKEYDSEPFPQLVFQYKQAKIKKESIEMSNLGFRDSTNILYKLDVNQRLYDANEFQDSLLKVIKKRPLQADYQNYTYYMKTQYGGLDGFEAFVDEELELTERAGQNLASEVARLISRKNWLIGDNDSIPLFLEVNISESRYLPKILTDKLTAGIAIPQPDILEGYFAMINEERIQNRKWNFPLDASHFTYEVLNSIQFLYGNFKGDHFLLYSIGITGAEEYACTLSKINEVSGVLWSKNITLATKPIELLINPNTDDIIINYDLENYLGDVVISDRLVLNKEGEPKP